MEHNPETEEVPADQDTALRWVSDGTLTSEEVISITVTNFNQAPVLSPIGDRRASEGQVLSFQIWGTDPDGTEVTFSAANLPAGAAFDPATRVFEWAPNFNQAGSYPGIVFNVTDGFLADSEIITIVVENVNGPPSLDPIGDKAVIAGQLLTFTILARDLDGDRITYSVKGLPMGEEG